MNMIPRNTLCNTHGVRTVGRSVGRLLAFDDDGTDASTVGRTGGRGRRKGDLRGRLHRRVRLEPHASQGLCERNLQQSKTSASVLAQSIWGKEYGKY